MDVRYEERVTTLARFFRAINCELVDAEPDTTSAVPLVCECPVIHCADELRMSPREFREIMRRPRCFAVLPGHESSRADRTVERRDSYWIVERPDVDGAEADTPPRELDDAQEDLLTVVRAAVRHHCRARSRTAVADARLRELQDRLLKAGIAERRFRGALEQYHKLMRHRIANPLTAVLGIADTLNSQPELDADTERQLLDALSDATRLLGEVVLDATPDQAIELVVDPWGRQDD